MSHQALLALGSNLGNPVENLRQALRQLSEQPGISVKMVSRFYETEPQGMRSDDPAQAFVNAMALLETTLVPQELLSVCLMVEQALGRNRFHADKRQGYASRTLDLDILFYDDRHICENGLEIPHPRLHERAFVLIPLAELVPDWVHPVFGKTIRQLAGELPEQAWVRPLLSELGV